MSGVGKNQRNRLSPIRILTTLKFNPVIHLEFGIWIWTILDCSGYSGIWELGNEAKYERLNNRHKFGLTLKIFHSCPHFLTSLMFENIALKKKISK